MCVHVTVTATQKALTKVFWSKLQMLKKFEVDRSLLFGVFQELSLLHQKNLATNFTHHGVLQVKNKLFRFVILFKEVKQLI